MKKTVVILILALGAYHLYEQSGLPVVTTAATQKSTNNAAIEKAFIDRRSSVQVESEGIVQRVLDDDGEGDRHQRFVLRLSSGQTVLIAHNIDVAPRVPALKVGDTVRFAGEYEWNPEGGVIHWTHHDPQGRHAGGWLEHNGRRYD
jgi:hypothetical protein